jgi:hypothetical protein
MQIIPIPAFVEAFNEQGEATDYIATAAATGAQLALAIHYQNGNDPQMHRRNDLQRLFDRFRDAGGQSSDRVGMILKDL